MPGEPNDDEDADVSFHINYARPFIFALEAEPELAAFVERFKPMIDDPQTNEIRSDYSRDAFFRGWQSGNKLACKDLIQGRAAKDQAKLTLPADKIEKCWKWNLNLPQLDEEINADIFTPRIRPCLYKDLLFTAIVWPDAIPIALPEVVDILIVHRDINDKKKDVIVLPLQSVIPHLEAFPILEGASPYRLLKYEAPPQYLVDFF